uniref:Uncharacterized protein n=1 Tax=Candidatus Kentrum sp. FM TaxID=2126340 RepID=A0A450SLC4_9GAMM|nr:MAG: hypothetical protein BECKFM1743C_GA0114222_101392 [Candidatus Kentron sp. FM]VFJ64419.1 MAG: hypothetical protein BECKFM1743A_GA0114220_103563 [Candidatus Kentron sp. FM]VFK11675.1 MAG: hypothetical protein BECKFM1743B_GA0114221_102013 [Candidatus Kentron sp. FM]
MTVESIPIKTPIIRITEASVTLPEKGKERKRTRNSVPPQYTALELVDDCVEALCQQGCRSVLDKITVLERGEHIPETVAIGEAGRSAVLDELKSIMSVYGNVCRVK